MAVEIDGSLFEGGGSMIRNSIALSLHTGKPVRIFNIRKNRSKPGLQPQHLASIKLAQKISNSDVQGLDLGSKEILFIPQKVKGGSYEIDIGTAGSIPLMLQSILLPCILSGSRFIIRAKGGTDVPNAMGIDYLSNIFSYSIKDYATITVDTHRRGYYPEGQGRVDTIINSKYSEFDKDNFKPINLAGLLEITKVSIKLNASKSLSETRILERIQEYVSLEISKINYDHSITSYYQDSTGKGLSILLAINGMMGEKEVILGESIIIEKNMDPEMISKQIFEKVREHLRNNVPCDYHLADQLIGLVTFIGGSIKTSEITNHTLSNIYVSEQFAGKKINVQNGLIQIKEL